MNIKKQTIFIEFNSNTLNNRIHARFMSLCLSEMWEEDTQSMLEMILPFYLVSSVHKLYFFWSHFLFTLSSSNLTFTEEYPLLCFCYPKLSILNTHKHSCLLYSFHMTPSPHLIRVPHQKVIQTDIIDGFSLLFQLFKVSNLI